MAKDPVLRVVLVEDDEDIRELFTYALERVGFDVRPAATVAEARAALAAAPTDVMVADYSLPDGTAAALISLCADTRPAVCVLLTGFDARDVDGSGYDIVLTKPISADQLIGAIRPLALQRAAERAPVV